MTATIPEVSVHSMLSLQQRLARIVGKWTSQQGIQGSAIDDVELIRCDQPVSCSSAVYEPSLCFVVQGTKSIQLGDREIIYKPLDYLASSVHLPVLGRVIDASAEHPFLGVKLKVDPQEVADLVVELGDKAPPLDPYESCTEVECGLCVSSMDELMQEALLRLLRLLDSSRDIAILAPLARREILYRALMGEMARVCVSSLLPSLSRTGFPMLFRY